MITDLLVQQIESCLPYEPNREQSELLQQLAAFVLDGRDDSLFLLRGYAGTGKTSLVGALVKALTQLQSKVVLLAPTGRAAKVFSRYARHPAYTIHRRIYRQKSYSPDMEGFLIGENLAKHTLFIVDEASMIANSVGEGAVYGSGRLLDDLVEYVYSGEHCRLILLGDTAQLPPVGQERSPALDAAVMGGYGLNVVEYELREVARQAAESGILYNATRLRECMEEMPLSRPCLRVNGFPDVEALSGEYLVERISDSYDRVGLDETIVVTRSNKRANIFNQGIRNQILYREEELTAGDLLLVAKNNYFWGKDYKEVDFIANGDVARVVRVLKRTDMYGFRFADVQLYFPDLEVEMEAKILLDTLTSGIWTSGVETASAWRIHRTWHISFQNNTLSCPAQLWIRNRNCGKQGLRIWMDRMSVQLIALAQLNKRAKIHNTDSVGNMTDNGKIMGNEQISQPHLLLHVLQHVYHL